MPDLRTQALMQAAAQLDSLVLLCPCDDELSDPGDAHPDCPIHGDGETFVDQVRKLRAVAVAARGVRGRRCCRTDRDDTLDRALDDLDES